MEEDNNYYHYYVLVNTGNYDIKLIEKLLSIFRKIEKNNPNKKINYSFIPYFGNKTKKQVVNGWKAIMENSLNVK